MEVPHKAKKKYESVLLTQEVRLHEPRRERNTRVLVAMVVLSLLLASAAFMHYGPAPKRNPPPAMHDSLSAVVVDSKGRVKPVLYEEKYPRINDGEKIVIVEKTAVYPWSGGRKGAQLFLCNDKIGIKVVSSAKKEWLFAQVQRMVDSVSGEAAWTRDEFDGALVLLASVPEIPLPDLTEEAWDVVKTSTHVDQLFSFPEEKKRLDAKVHAHLSHLHDNMDLQSVQIESKDVCRAQAEAVEL